MILGTNAKSTNIHSNAPSQSNEAHFVRIQCRQQHRKWPKNNEIYLWDIFQKFIIIFHGRKQQTTALNWLRPRNVAAVGVIVALTHFGCCKWRQRKFQTTVNLLVNANDERLSWESAIFGFSWRPRKPIEMTSSGCSFVVYLNEFLLCYLDKAERKNRFGAGDTRAQKKTEKWMDFFHSMRKAVPSHLTCRVVSAFFICCCDIFPLDSVCDCTTKSISNFFSRNNGKLYQKIWWNWLVHFNYSKSRKMCLQKNEIKWEKK